MGIGLLNCGECGVEFRPSSSQWYTKHKGRKYCSRTCLGAGNRKSSKVWWNANPDTNTVIRPTVSCTYCKKEFTATPQQHRKLVKQPDANVYCTRECIFLNTGHTETRLYALKWMEEHPDVGGLEAAKALGIPYVTLCYWRKKAGMPFNKFTWRTMQNCGHCGQEYWPSSAQWHQRGKHKDQVCSEECRCALFSKRMTGMPKHNLRKHGLYGLEAQQTKLLRRKIKEFTKEGAKA